MSNANSQTSPPALQVPRRQLTPVIVTWGVIIAIHLLGFLAFYLVTVRLLGSEVSANAADMARERLTETANQLHAVAEAYKGDQPGGHLFDDILEAQTGISYRFFAPTGKIVGGEEDLSGNERVEILDFLVGDEPQLIWRSPDGPRMEGLVRLVADEDCVPCHTPGTTRGVISLSVDFGATLDHVRARSRRNLGLLVLAWAVIAGASYVLVHLSVRRWASRLESTIAGTESGEMGPVAPRLPVVLDPVSAELQESLKDFLARQRQKQAEMTSRLAHTDRLASLGQLAADLAGQIRDPIAGVQGALQILRDDATDESSGRLCNEMLADLKRVDSTLQALLSSAQPSPPRLSTVDVRDLIQEVIRLMEPAFDHNGVTLRTEVGTERLEAVADAAQIRQVLIDLLQNAAEALESTPGGLVTLKAGWLPTGDGIILTVEDNGPGIPEADHDKIFEPFYSTKFSGTGLGLANARSLVEQHGGSLQVESTQGDGTTFFVILPTSESVSAEADSIGPGSAEE